MKWRNSKERELLSSGASRDITLTGKDNTHATDLSDALRRHDLTTAADAFPTCSGGAGFPGSGGGFPVVAATDLRMRSVDYGGGRCDDVIVYDVIGSGDKHRCMKPGVHLSSEDSADRDDTIHVM